MYTEQEFQVLRQNAGVQEVHKIDAAFDVEYKRQLDLVNTFDIDARVEEEIRKLQAVQNQELRTKYGNPQWWPNLAEYKKAREEITEQQRKEREDVRKQRGRIREIIARERALVAFTWPRETEAPEGEVWNQLTREAARGKLSDTQNSTWVDSENAANEPTLDAGIPGKLLDWFCEEFKKQLPVHAKYALEGKKSRSDEVFDEEHPVNYEVPVNNPVLLKRKENKKLLEKANELKSKAMQDHLRLVMENLSVQQTQQKAEQKVEEVAEQAEQLQEQMEQTVTATVSAATEKAESLQEKMQNELQDKKMEAFKKTAEKWKSKNSKKIKQLLEKTGGNIAQIVRDSYLGPEKTMSAINKQLEKAVTGIRKIMEESKENLEETANKVNATMVNSVTSEVQKKAADAARKATKAATDQASAAAAALQNAADSARQKALGKINALMGK